jgi:hypothetical protein
MAMTMTHYNPAMKFFLRKLEKTMLMIMVQKERMSHRQMTMFMGPRQQAGADNQPVRLRMCWKADL